MLVIGFLLTEDQFFCIFFLDLAFFFFLNKIYLFIFERGRVPVCAVGRRRGTVKENLQHEIEHGASHRAWSHNREIMTLAEIKNQSLN